MADAHLGRAYDLVWKFQEYDEAVCLLLQALEIQEAYLGKHHKQVGYTHNFLGSALWMQGLKEEETQPKGKLYRALTHFGQARFIFCKCYRSPQSKGKSSKVIRAIDERITCVLRKLRYPKHAVDDYHDTLTAVMEHELVGDRCYEKGELIRAKVEYRKATRLSIALQDILAASGGCRRYQSSWPAWI
jgi:tetratricopeptide (TPR) repeat protein